MFVQCLYSWCWWCRDKGRFRPSNLGRSGLLASSHRIHGTGGDSSQSITLASTFSPWKWSQPPRQRVLCCIDWHSRDGQGCRRILFIPPFTLHRRLATVIPVITSSSGIAGCC
ncbi:hypothetical protein LY78DRAFT_234003 [Colletotrichum sublineola]|nr:hypothetical protein LY78DRAFT_234003 [Colletotrichum sublineola]